MTLLHATVEQIADAKLADQQFVTAVDVLIGLGWVAPDRVDVWQRGVVSSLDRCIRASSAETAQAVEALRIWAQTRDLQPWATAYNGLRFTADGDHETEQRFRIRWAPAAEPAPKLPLRSREPKVLAAEHAVHCGTCGDADFLLRDQAGGICLHCAGVGHLVFLPSGDAALTRLATKAGPVTARVLQLNRLRLRHERRGILAEQRAIELAAAQCLADPDRLQRKATVDEPLRREIADTIRAEFPGCPPARAEVIAYVAAVRNRRRDRNQTVPPDTVRLAVTESVRHIDTDYPDALLSGCSRAEARRRVQGRLDAILDAWTHGVTALDL